MLLLRLSFESSTLPAAWKEANVTPIYKKGGRCEPGNYRPVSLTSIVCKLLESIVRDAVLGHLVENDLLSPAQHGFVPNKSCTTNLLECLDFITAQLVEGHLVDELLLDYEKAFDTVPHRGIVVKLDAYGVDGKIKSWISEFLSERRQRVVIDNHRSSWAKVTSGVPQGSVLGPLLFIIFINDLPDVVKNLIKLYADDSKILAVVDDATGVSNLQKDLDGVVHWSASWGMRLNVKKCRVIHFGAKGPPQYDYRVDQTVIESSDCERDLGVLVSADLKWKSQAEAAVGRANRILGSLRRAFQHNSVDLWRMLYILYIRPHLEFAIPVWNPHRKDLVDRLEKVQARATKVPFCLRHLNYEERLRAFGIEKLESRRNRGDLIQIFKARNGFESIQWHSDVITRPVTMTTRGNSQRMMRQIFRSRVANDRCAAVDVRHNFLTNRVVPIWNKLPEEAVRARSVNVFKARYDEWVKSERDKRR
jgi:hypothetical protein